ncbi:MAG: enediyne biosynthesis protein [Chloroflexota bacterium]|jgi:Na+-transporting NADH:ubiquinone oxidoreductase subunit NqrB|nr:enediyne biosynthesis protein [Chloroflexota bacterium]
MVSAKRRAARLFGREYTVILPSIRDPRLHVAAVLVTLQVLGQTVLGFRLSVAQILICLATGAVIEFVVAFFKDSAIMWPASGLLTGNSTAFILRTPGTLHGQWWSTHGIWIFIGVVAISMASKYLIRWRGRHIFNPSNLGLVIAFVALGPKLTEPQDLWWIPPGPWLIVTYAVLVVGGLLIAWELRLLGLEIAFMAGFAAFTALALALVPDHCMVASWHVAPMCGRELWQILVTSPELLVFGLFMIPDPRTVPDGPVARVAFGIVVAILAVLLIGPTSLEFWTKTAILASLVIACALRFALVRFLSPLEARDRQRAGRRRLGWRLPAALAVALLFVGTLPVAADLSTHSPEPAAGLADGTTPTLKLTVGDGPDVASWVSTSARIALPPQGNSGPASASAQLWILPTIPTATIAPNVVAFDKSAPQNGDKWTHDVVLDLIIESEARRAHDFQLAESGASGDALKEFTDVIKDDISAGKIIQKTYSFDKVSLNLYLPKFSSQASRLVGVSLQGTSTFITRDASGNVLSQSSTPYSKSWGLDTFSSGSHMVIINDYTDLAPAP